MKFAICNETYQDKPIEYVCEHAVGCGYDGVEIAPFTLNDDPRRLGQPEAIRVGEVVRAAGLEVVGLHWLLVQPKGLHLVTCDKDVHRETIEFGQHLARLCAAMEGKVMVWGSPQQRNIGSDQSYEDAFGRATDALRQIAETAGPLGITIALEPLSTAETNFLTTADETVRLIHAVGHKACQLHLDVKAMSSEEKAIPTIIRENRNLIAHFHANDPNLRGPGFGDVDYTPIAKALEEIRYDGYVSVEVFDYSPDAETIAIKSLEYLRRHFSDMEMG